MDQTTDIFIFRYKSGYQGTAGILAAPGLCFSCYSMELPWRDNQMDISCIPAGTYDLAWSDSGRIKGFEVLNVPARSRIKIHAGNWAGDIGQGYRSDVEGCILLGRAIGIMDGQLAVLTSRPAVAEFNDRIRRERSVRLTIRDGFGGMNG